MKYEKTCPHKSVSLGTHTNLTTGGQYMAWMCDWCYQLFISVSEEEFIKMSRDETR